MTKKHIKNYPPIFLQKVEPDLIIHVFFLDIALQRCWLGCLDAHTDPAGIAGFRVMWLIFDLFTQTCS